MAMIKFNMVAAVVLKIILGDHELLILCGSRLHDCVPSTYSLCLHMHNCFQHGCMYGLKVQNFVLARTCMYIHVYTHIILLHKKGSVLDTILSLIYKEQ